VRGIDLDYININEGGSLRMDCPLCLNRNTLSLKKVNGKILWNCFHVSCNNSGSNSRGYSISDIENIFTPKKKEEEKFVMPKSFVSIYPNPRAMQYLKDYNINPYDCNARIMYDVSQDRIVFLIDIDGIVRGAVGRTLSNKVPRWYKYNSCDYPFVVGEDVFNAVIVEDCVSACAVAPIHTGIAIMGTSLSDKHANYIRGKFRKVYICLDPDANAKTFDIREKLGYSVDSKIVLIPKDLKYMKQEEIKELLHGD
tara:strand:+ start:1916 stop:2677 length:762 start_codon:yes stop_codon:yes gene_type:complete